MSRPKQDVVKEHITATISPAVSGAITLFRDDPVHFIDGEKMSRSSIIQKALEVFLYKYLKPKEIPKVIKATTPNSVTVTSNEDGTEHDE
jgi:hypothetical protein